MSSRLIINPLDVSRVRSTAILGTTTNMNASSKASVLGGFSFEAESLPDCSEFDSASIIEIYQFERLVVLRMPIYSVKACDKGLLCAKYRSNTIPRENSNDIKAKQKVF